MRRWMLLLLLPLLLHLQLGNAPRSDGGQEASHALCASLPPPSNVSISSFNMEHRLGFLPGAGTPPAAGFTVEIGRLRRGLWRPVASCQELTAGQTCNLTRALKDPFHHYRARVRAFTANRTSAWTESAEFQPMSDTVLGPPDVAVSGCGNCLVLQLRLPATRGPEQLQLLKDLYRELLVHVRRTRDGAQFTLTLHYKEEMVVSYLQPGVEYCVSVSAKSIFNSNAVSSKPHCAFTSAPPPTSSLLAVYGVLGVLSGLLVLVFGSVIYLLSLTPLRQRLLKSLSYFLFRGWRGGRAPGEPSGPIAAS